MHIFKDEAIFFPVVIFSNFSSLYKNLCWTTSLLKFDIVRFLNFCYLVMNIKLFHILVWNCISTILTKIVYLFIFFCRDMYDLFLQNTYIWGLYFVLFVFTCFYAWFLYFFSWVNIFLNVIPFTVMFQKSCFGLSLFLLFYL